MNEEFVAIIFEMISAAGAAKSKYMEAVGAAKHREYEKAEALLKEGGACFAQAHHIHADILAKESEESDFKVSLILVHGEDQMMSAETTRLMATELIDVYKKLHEREGSVSV